MGIDTPSKLLIRLRWSRSWRSGAMRRNPLQGWFQHRTEQQRHLGLRGKGPERMGERPLAECHESLVLQSSPMGRKGSPNLHTRVTSGHFSFLFSDEQKQTWNNTRFRCSFAVVKNNLSDLYTDFLVWEHSTGAENAMLASRLQGPEYVKPAFLTNVGSLASTTFMRVILLLSHILYSLLTGK